MAGYPSWNVQYGYRVPVAAETVGGLDLAKSSAAYIGLPIADRPSIDPGLAWHSEAKARGVPYRHQDDFNLVGKAPKFSFTCPMTSYFLCDFLYSMFMGITSEAAGSPFAKVFSIPTTSRSIVTGDAVSALFTPHVLDFVRANPGLSGAGTDLDEVLVDGVVTKMVLSFANGVLSAAVDVAGFDADVSASDFAGTITNSWNAASPAGQAFCNAMYMEVGTTVLPIQEFTLTLDPGTGIFMYQKATPHSMLLAASSAGWGNTKLSIQVPLDQAAVNDLFTNLDPSAIPFVAGGGLTGVNTRLKLYGPIAASEGGTTAANDIQFDGYWAIQSIQTGGADQQLCTVECDLSWDGSNTPLVITISDGVDRVWT